MNQEAFWLVVAMAAVAVGVALVIIAAASFQVARDARRALRSIETELPPRLERLDRLADEAEATMTAVRAAADSAQSIVRGPADVVEGARRTAENVGRGILGSADRLRRRVSGDEAAGTEPAAAARVEEAVGESGVR